MRERQRECVCVREREREREREKQLWEMNGSVGGWDRQKGQLVDGWVGLSAQMKWIVRWKDEFLSGEVAGWMNGCVINGRMDGLDG